MGGPTTLNSNCGKTATLQTSSTATTWGVKGSGQQLRFANGQYSYGISSWFIAGVGGDEGVAFFILKDGKLIKWRERKADDWFTEDNQLSSLPRDRLWVSPEGVKTGGIPGVTPFP